MSDPFQVRANKKSHVNETRLSSAIVTKLNNFVGVKCQKIHGSAYMKPTLDILGVKDGRLFWLEVKQPGKSPTPRQKSPPSP